MESQTIISRFKSCASRTPFGYMHYASPLFSCPNFVSTSVFLGVCAIPMIRETYISPILSSLATVNSSFRSQDLPFHTKTKTLFFVSLWLAAPFSFHSLCNCLVVVLPCCIRPESSGKRSKRGGLKERTST